MQCVHKLLVAASLGAASLCSQASTLVFNYAGEVNSLVIPPAYADLYDVWNSDGDFDDFFGTVIVENFERYLTGTHVLDIAPSSSPLKLSLVSGLLTGIEGTRHRQTGTFAPDDSQVGTAGALTIVDGAVTGFSWAAYGTRSAALAGFNDRTLAGFPVQIGSIEITVGPSSPLLALADGETLFGQNVRGTAAVTMVPEPGTYGLFAAGLGALAFVGRRRRATPT